MKAKFQLTMLTDASVPIVLFNVPLVNGSSSSADSGSGLRRWEFGTTPIMSSYLVAFALGKAIACTWLLSHAMQVWEVIMHTTNAM